MDVRQLRYFLSIVEAGSISRAAAELRVAQPALSQHVANLETELGARLLVRSQRGVQPTECGQRLVEHARLILGQIGGAIEDIRSYGRAPTGEVTLGLSAGMAVLIAAPLLATVRARYPGIVLRIVDGLSGTLLEWAQKGRVDLSLTFDIDEKAGVAVAPILREEIELVTVGGVASPVAPRELARQRLILPSRPHRLRLLVERYARSVGVELRVDYEIDAMAAILTLVKSRLGCSLLPFIAAADDLRRGELCLRPLEPRLERTVVLVHPQGRPATGAVDAIQEALQEVVCSLVARGAWPAKLMIPHAPARPPRHPEIEAIGF